MITITVPKELLQEGQKPIEPRTAMSKKEIDGLLYYLKRDETYAYYIPLKKYVKMTEAERNDLGNAIKVKIEGVLHQ